MKFTYKLIICFILAWCTATLFAYSQKPFTVVIDAGHGGHDSGAVGKIAKEKNINLAVALKLGNLINEKHPSVKVVYTRRSDVFIPLQRRADIANENSADIFFSIHTNATKGPSAFGTETFVLGLHKTQSNLEVAMRENSVIALEEGYKTKYQGFDPKSIDSYIMFEYMQDRYLDKSLQLASLIEDQFKRTKRYSRGVRQAGFLVLHKSACPSVLVELGFISNPQEERFLNSDDGRTQLANAIFKAFEAYKREHDRKSGIATVAPAPDNTTSQVVANETVEQITPETGDAVESKTDKVVFKIQLFALEKVLPANNAAFKGLQDVTYYKEGNFYKYTYGETGSYKETEAIRKSIQKKFPEAYIIAFKGETKITVSEAIKLSENK